LRKFTHISGFVDFTIIFVVVIIVAVTGFIVIQNRKQAQSLMPVEVPPTSSTQPEVSNTPEASPSAETSPSASPSTIPSPSPSKPTPSPIAAVSGPPGSGYSRITVKTERGNFTASVVSIDMAGVRMVTDTANEDNCTTDCPVRSLADYVTSSGGFAGINGSYFCPETYPDCADKKNSFDFPVYNSRLSKWINNDKLFWNSRSMVYYDGGIMHFQRDANSFSGSLSAGVVNYPGLLDGGNVIVDEGSLSEKQATKGTKGGIGIRGNTVYLIIASGVNMADFAHVFKSLGADSAMNLDGGGSSALWFGGYKVGPGRSLPNAVIFSR